MDEIKKDPVAPLIRKACPDAFKIFENYDCYIDPAKRGTMMTWTLDEALNQTAAAITAIAVYCAAQ